MRTLRRLLPVLIGALSLFAILASSALAAPEFLDGTVKGLKFTFTSGTSTLTSGFVITSSADKGTGEVTGPKTISATVDFEKSQILGLAANSLGDASGIILTEVTGELCTISTAPLEIGVLFTVAKPVHIEVTSIGELVVVTGTVIGKVDTPNKLQTTGTISLPKPAIAACKTDAGKEVKAELLGEKGENGKKEKATEVTTESLTFEKDIETMG